MKKLIATSLITTLLSVSFSFAQSLKRPPLPPELKEGLDKIKEAVDAKEITPEEAKKKRQRRTANFRIIVKNCTLTNDLILAMTKNSETSSTKQATTPPKT